MFEIVGGVQVARNTIEISELIGFTTNGAYLALYSSSHNITYIYKVNSIEQGQLGKLFKVPNKVKFFQSQ
jgi:hypothetical protein